MDKDLDDDVPLPRLPFLTEVFPTGVPHMRYQRIVTLANGNQVSKVARGLWQNSRLVLKKLTTDRRVRFGVWGAGTEEDRQRAPRKPVLDGQALIIAPSGFPRPLYANMQRYLVSSPQSRLEGHPRHWGEPMSRMAERRAL